VTAGQLGRRAALAAALTLGGCTVGGGSGSVDGAIWVLGCNNGQTYGQVSDGGVLEPAPYTLQPQFFAGVPIEDLMQGPMQTNEIEMRMQSTGLSIMYNDTLYFDVLNSYEVARCVRGRILADGTPDWKVTESIPTNALIPAIPGSSPPSTPWCDWSATAFADGGTVDGAVDGAVVDAGTTPDGGMSVMAQFPKIHLTPYTDLHSSLGLLATCPTATVAGVALDGWVEFQNFGTAAQPDKAPMDRDPVPAGFIINFGDRLRATFHVVLADQQVVDAVMNNVRQPDPQIAGTLDGFFDFNLQRGRGAQPFP